MENGGKIMMAVIIPVLVITVGALIYFPVECTEVKADYENNPEFAREKYGYDSFEQWLDNTDSGVTSTCWPKMSKNR